ncbi:hypothetical protein DFA_09203 [Cavenderia fasciculata]|uniref:Uncharacterized protein n=1 Tax=Cavenderia fasciculata TaxID=261658 RepID=F4Q6Z3_CACFS|nr:uncharacterized protein DFA_09203 [Cavenderia fasciculata]EGG16175.1 hypothetical protein DFA_09203 [Cavenderia fasciculata]|eukprot:XP_004352628.1 hypothetical protein DFA_09203 [Cavenderia fasciculata]
MFHSLSTSLQSYISKMKIIILFILSVFLFSTAILGLRVHKDHVPRCSTCKSIVGNNLNTFKSVLSPSSCDDLCSNLDSQEQLNCNSICSFIGVEKLMNSIRSNGATGESVCQSLNICQVQQQDVRIIGNNFH